MRGQVHVTVITVSAALLVAGLAAWDFNGTSPVGRVGAVFNEAVLDLKLNGQDHITDTLDGERMVGGDALYGEIRLYANGTAQLNPSNYDLDFDFRHVVSETVWAHANASGAAMTTYLILTQLKYGTDDLLKSPGRNLTADIDGNPNLGNGDGRLSLKEMEAGCNDLPLPGPFGNPTLFSLQVTFDNATPNHIMGDRTRLTIVFQASDLPHEDLN